MLGFSFNPSWWNAARQRQLVQGDAPVDDPNEPPALLIAITLVGALVCVVPLAGFVLLALGEKAWTGAGSVVLSLLLLVAAGVLLRVGNHVFLSCVALVLWILGCGLLLFNFGVEQLDSRQGMLMILALAAALQMLGAWLSSARWLQAIMGVGWAGSVYGVLLVLQSWTIWLLPMWMGVEVMALLWLFWLRGEATRVAQVHTRWAVFADAAVVGLLALIASGGYGLLGLFTSSLWESGDSVENWLWVFSAMRVLDVAAVLAATALLVWGWKQRGLLSQELQNTLILAGVLLAICAWFSPSLGPVALIAAGALLTARWRIAIACALVALSLLGRFYYQLSWPLAIKGIGIAALGAALLLGLLVLRRSTLNAANQPVAASQASKAQLGWVLLGAVLVFGLVNWDVRGKEQVIAHGQRILVPLVPVDPRSLMQGDYMDLRFDLPSAIQEGLEKINAPVAYVNATVDAQGVASVKALVDGAKMPGPGEIILPLKQLKGRWVLVTDAYFFPEGQGGHFAKGRFGDFRVLPGGRALLVGLADDQKQEIQPLPGGSIWDWRPAAERLDAQQRGEDASDSEPAARVVEERAAEQAPPVEVEATTLPPPPPPSVSRP